MRIGKCIFAVGILAFAALSAEIPHAMPSPSTLGQEMFSSMAGMPGTSASAAMLSRTSRSGRKEVMASGS